MKLLILSNNENGYSTQKLKSEAESRGHDVEVKNPLDLVPFISETISGHDHLFEKDDQGRNIRVLKKTYDCVLPRFAGSQVFNYGIAILQHLAGNLAVPTANDSLGLTVASNKLLSHQALSLGKVRTIATMFVNKPVDFDFIVKKLGMPIVVKTPQGSQGSGVFILETELSISTTLQAFSRINKNLILQRFINSGNPKSDLRVYVVDSKVVAAYRRWALHSDFRSNYSISKQGEKVELTNEEKQMAVDAANSCGLSICGVDIVRDSNNNNQPHCIEVNGNASLAGIEAVTNENVAGAIIDFCEKISRKGNAGYDGSLSASGHSSASSGFHSPEGKEPETLAEFNQFCKTNSGSKSKILEQMKKFF